MGEENYNYRDASICCPSMQSNWKCSAGRAGEVSPESIYQATLAPILTQAQRDIRTGSVLKPRSRRR
jgi:hypothetical protein